MATVNERRQMARGTAAQWASANPILLEGERAYETDTGREKIGDGTTAYNDLSYSRIPSYETVAGMKATNEDLSGLVTGDRIFAGRYVYERAANDAAAALKTTEGWPLPLNPLPVEDGSYAIDAFDAVGDDSTDDTAAFLAFQNIALADPNNVSAVLSLTQDKIYRYSNNRWPQAFKELTINANGAGLRCIGNETFAIDNNALNFKGWNNEEQLDPRSGGAIEFQGYLIDSAVRGQDTITLSTAAEAANLAANDWCLVYGFANQDGGAPIDARYFEYKRVVSADPGTGEVVFDSLLEYDYNANWPEIYTFQWTADAAGPPRVLPLKRTNRYLTERLIVNDAKFLLNPNATSTSRLAVVGVLDAEFNHCDMSDLVETTVGSVRYATFNSCNLGDVEGDKLTDRVVFNRCTAGAFTQFVGTKIVEIKHMDISTSARLGADNIVYENNRFIGFTPDLNYTNARRVEKLVFKNNQILAAGRINQEWWKELAFSAVDGSNNLRANKSDVGSWEHIRAGMRVASVDGSAIATITDIEEFDSDEVVFLTEWETAVPSLPVTLFAATHGHLQFDDYEKAPWEKRGSKLIVDFSSENEFWKFDEILIFGPALYPVSVEVNILRASAVSNGQLWLRNDETSQNGLQIDTGTAGYRKITSSEALTTLLAGDTFTAANMQWGYWRLQPRTGGNNSIVGNPDELPIFQFRAEFATLLN